MRGVGTGVVVTAAILLLLGKPKELTEEQIRIEAAKLGMVDAQEILEKEETNERIENMIKEAEANPNQTENTSFTEDVKEGQMTEAIEEEIKEPDGKKDENLSVEEVTENNLETSETNQVIEKDDPGILETRKEEVEEDLEKPTDYIQVIIESGDVGRTVSTKLYEAGLIESVEDYSTFLSANDYSRKLRAGTYFIPIGATKEEIAAILCKLSD